MRRLIIVQSSSPISSFINSDFRTNAPEVTTLSPAFNPSSIVASSRDAESAIDTFFAGSRSRGDFRSDRKKVAEQNVKASTLPFSAASTNAGTAVVDEDPEDDEGDAKDDGQDGPEEGGVALRKQNLQNPGSKLGKRDGSQIRTDFRGETINLCLVLEQSAMCYISSEAVILVYQ